MSGPLLKFAPIQIATLSAGASAAIPLLMELSSGTSAVAAERTARKARAVEPQFLGDELVETTLAEAELDANHPEAAEQAADRAAGLNPRNTDAIILQGRAIAARAVKANATERHALFEQARDKFIAANRIDPEDPEPLMEFCMTFALEGVRANANAIAALHYASDLAPQDLGLRMNSAVQYLAENKPAEARRALIPIAYNPHDHEYGDKARDMVSKIDSGDLKAALAIVKAGPRWQPASN